MPCHNNRYRHELDGNELAVWKVVVISFVSGIAMMSMTITLAVMALRCLR